MTLLTIHLYVAFVVAALAVLAVWRTASRRITLYVVALQIVLGIVLMAQHLRVPWYHPALAILAAGALSAANVAERRAPGTRVPLIVAGLAALLLLLAYYVGLEAVKHGGAG